MRCLIIFFFILSQVFPQDRLPSDSSTATAGNSPGGSAVKFKILPFSYYDNSVGVVLGGLGSIKGFLQQETFAKTGGIVSTSGTYYGFLQIENFQIPQFPRIFLRPDIYVGKVKDIKLYLNAAKDEYTSPGANESEQNDYVSMEGNDQWYEFNVKYLLPIGHGKENAVINPVFNNGILVSGETGGAGWNPLQSGRTFLETKFFYRDINLHGGSIKYDKQTLGFEFALSHENMDYFFNPTEGSFERFAYTVDWGAAGENNQFNTLKFDYRLFLPLYDKEADELPFVLAFNFVTMDTPSWNDYNIITTSGGKEVKVFHRPQLFLSANLGGEKRLRSYPRYRFYDKAMIYYSLELRKNLGWNPFNLFSFTRDAGINFIQLGAFLDFGRVAPQWNLKTFHRRMKWSAGGGVRLFIEGLVVRVDVAGGKEGVLTQMFVDHAF